MNSDKEVIILAEILKDHVENNRTTQYSIKRVMRELEIKHEHMAKLMFNIAKEFYYGSR